jgi:hypothetical protein
MVCLRNIAYNKDKSRKETRKKMGKAKIFIRERRKVTQGEKKPRYSVVGIAGTDLKIYAKHIRKMEIDQMAAAIGAEVICLESGKEEADVEVDE